MSTETFEAFVREQSAETLANVLLQLATDQVAVYDRLVGLQLSNQSEALAASFRQTLTDWCEQRK